MARIKIFDTNAQKWVYADKSVGKTPVKGVDYYTDEEKGEFSEYIATELAKRSQLKPEFAESEEWLKQNGDTTKLYVLPNNYIFAWIPTEIVTGGYTNLIEPVIGNTYPNGNQDIWIDNCRFNGSAVLTQEANKTTSNKIECTGGDIIRIKIITDDEKKKLTSTDRIQLTYLDPNGQTKVTGHYYLENSHVNSIVRSEYKGLIDGVYEFELINNGATITGFRFAMPTPAFTTVEEIKQNYILTKNEPIIEPTITKEYAWTSTGHAFVPADYEDRIVEVETQTTANATNLVEYAGNIAENATNIAKNTESIADAVNRIEVLESGATATDIIPSYWEDHIVQKIEIIKNLHKKYGRDCFSFIFMTDIHYPSNLGKKSPILAKKIADDCDIKYVLCGGDTQTRGCYSTKQELLEENEQISKFFEPIIDKLLRTEGNHDGSYGKFDKDGNDKFDNTGKPIEDYESYLSNLTPQELHEHIYRKVGMVGNVHFDKTGTAYYIDDTSNNVRYIGLNTQYNKYELRDDATEEHPWVKYPKMWLFRFTQPQFDFIINKALVNGIDDDTNIVLFGHCPLTSGSIKDGEIMGGILNAFKNKTSYQGTYEGTGIAETKVPNFKNLFDEEADGFAKGIFEGLYNPQIVPNKDTTVTNKIPVRYSKENPCVLRMSYPGLGTLSGSFNVVLFDSSDNPIGASIKLFSCYAYPEQFVIENDVMTWNVGAIGGNVSSAYSAVSYVQFALNNGGIGINDDKIIITVDEPITYTENPDAKPYDYVSVNADFTNAKGKLVGYFSGHEHRDLVETELGFNVIGTRCDGHQENDKDDPNGLWAERNGKTGTTFEQSFDVFTVTPDKIYATKIGAGSNRTIGY